MLPLSVAIITHNECARLGKTLTAIAAISTEIIVVDSGSTDNTIAIAESYGARVIRKGFTSYSEQRNYALSQCTQPWVLYLNAGDFVSVELRIRLQSIISGNDCDYFGNPIHPANENNSSAVYSLRVKQLWFGRVVRFGEWRPRYEPRLFRRGSNELESIGQFDNSEFDGKFVVSGSPCEYKIPQVLRRYLAVELGDYIQRMNRHSSVYARYLYDQRRGEARASNKRVIFFRQSWLQIKGIAQFIYTLLVSYIAKGGFLNLTAGLPLSFSSSLTLAAANFKLNRFYVDYSGMYEFQRFEVAGGSPDDNDNDSDNDYDSDRAFDSSGRLIIRRLLIARTDMIGDMIVCIPAINMARRMYPDARLDVLASVYNRDIVTHLPMVDNIYVRGAIGKYTPDNEDPCNDEWLISTLNANKYDVIVALNSSPKVNDFMAKLYAPYKVAGTEREVYRQGVMLNDRLFEENIYASEYALYFIRHIDPERYDSVLEVDRTIPYSDVDKAEVGEFLSSRNLIPCYDKPHRFQKVHGEGFARGCVGESDTPRGYIAVNIYGSGIRIHLSLLTYRKIVMGLSDMGYQVVVIAIPYNPRIYNGAIAEKYFGDIDGVHIFQDATSVLRTVALIHGAEVYVGAATGPTHMASAYEVPTVTSFVDDPVEIRAWSPRHNHAAVVPIPSWERITADHIAYVNDTVTEVCFYTQLFMEELYER